MGTANRKGSHEEMVITLVIGKITQIHENQYSYPVGIGVHGRSWNFMVKSMDFHVTSLNQIDHIMTCHDKIFGIFMDFDSI